MNSLLYTSKARGENILKNTSWQNVSPMKMCILGVSVIKVNHVDSTRLQGPQEMAMYISVNEQTTFGYKQSSHYLFNMRFKSLYNVIFHHVY